jgi:hypothetical protein
MKVNINSIAEGFIYGLSVANFSYSNIIKLCSEKGLIISKSTVCRVIRKCNQRPDILQGCVFKSHRNKIQPQRSPATIKNIRQHVLKENPPTQRSLANRLSISQSTVSRIISRNLNLQKHHKALGHYLTDKHVKERFKNSRKLYEKHLSGDKWQWVVTLDEAWVYLNDTNKPRAIFYRDKGCKGRSNFVMQCKEKFSKGFMVVAGYCSRGILPIRRVASNAKINSAYFQRHVLEPIYREDIPRLYGNEASKVWIHMDKASSHTSRSSMSWYAQMEAETQIHVIPFSHIPVKSPDASPMDFCGFGLLKRGIASRRPKTIEGLWKVCNEIWQGIPLTVLRKSLLQWKLRCRAIVRNRGFHIEHNRWWTRGIN